MLLSTMYYYYFMLITYEILHTDWLCDLDALRHTQISAGRTSTNPPIHNFPITISVSSSRSAYLFNATTALIAPPYLIIIYHCYPRFLGDFFLSS